MDLRAALWFAIFLLVLMLLAARSRRLRQPMPWIYVLFFCSGFPALIYQIVWQRALFGIYGVNVESVTIVVSAFMCGLGIGSLIGGALSRKAKPLLILFAIAELGTAAFGVVSLQIFRWVAQFTAGAPPFQTGLLSFSLVVVPTVLMGATLPLLVEHIVRTSRNVGFAVGGLYFVNTLGSAAACFVAGDVLMRDLGQTGSVRFAVMINVVVGSGVLLYSMMRPAASEPSSESVHSETTTTAVPLPLPFSLALLAAAFSGFLALSYEIMWYRLLTFASGAIARAFAFLLGSYLLGVALGSRLIERYARNKETSGRIAALRLLGWIMLVSSIVSFAVGPLSGLLAPLASVYTLGGASLPAYLTLLLLIGVGAFFFGATFPLISHVSVSAGDRAGSGLSYLYAANIAGSTLGSFVVGFILMDYFSLRAISAMLMVAGLAFALLLLAQTRPTKGALGFALAGSACAAAILIAATGPVFATIYDRLMFKKAYPKLHFRQIVETHNGTVGVTPDGTVYGGGVYDGHFNIDLRNDLNLVIRAYALSALHPSPHHVLMIGLASGSWAQVIANNPQVEDLTIVEINSGYLQLIPQFRDVASVLRNPKVRIEVDDGRRWLLHNRDARFDAIVINTTLHWRDHASNLLSVEFLQIARRHLRENGVLFYNATSSDDVLATGISVFPHALRFTNSLAVSDAPIDFDRERWRKILLGYTIDGKKLLDPASVERIISIPDDPTGRNPYSVEQDGELRRRLQHRLIITDDNMGVEWRG